MATTKKATAAKKKAAPARKSVAPAKKKSAAAVTGPAARKKKAVTRDPKGGLTAAGRAEFAKKEGAHLRPGVTGDADTPDKMRRKGSFLRRFFLHLRGPLVDAKGQPTRLALSAHAWGEKVPKTEEDARKLAEKGEKLLAKYERLHGGQQKPKRAAAKKKPAAS